MVPQEYKLTYTRPHAVSRINWQDPRHDPMFRQFIPLKSLMRPDHSKCEIDSLHEEDDKPVGSLVHRYPDKALFLRKLTRTPFCRMYISHAVFLLIMMTDGSDCRLPYLLRILHSIMGGWTPHH